MLSSRTICYALSAVFLLSPVVRAEESSPVSKVSRTDVEHPFLTKSLLVPWSGMTPDKVKPDMSIVLANSERSVEEICSLTPDRMNYERTFGALERLQSELDVYWTRVEVLSNVRDEPALRKVMAEMMPRVSEFQSSLTKNKKLWEVLKKAEERVVDEPLSHDQARLVSETMILFRDSGADLPVPEQERLLQIDKALADWTRKFSDMVQDSQHSWVLFVEDESELEGLSQAVKDEAERAAATEAGGEAGKRRWKFTYNSAAQGGLMTHLKNDDLRRRVWEGISGVGTGKYDTDPMIREILKLRDEKAKLCGCSSYPDYILKRRMAGSGKKALQFVDGLHGRISKAYKVEMADLRKFKEKKTGKSTDALSPWETAYWESQQKQDLYSYDPESVRPYYPVDNVLKEIFSVVSSLYDIDVKERKTACLSGETPANSRGAVEVWDPSVRFYEIYDRKTSEHLGSFYLDIYPRKNKRSGAWMGPMVHGSPAMGDRPRQPHLGMIGANIRPPMGGQPALLTQREMCTLFHETGHLMHLMLSNVSVPSLGGTAVAWDFVELPSQIMENWCWDRSILKKMSTHYETGEQIPDSLLDSLLKSRFYHPAHDLMGQLALSKLDLELHRDPSLLNNITLEQADDRLLKSYKPEFSCPVPSRARAMRHLFASMTGYSAGYYSYRWAEQLEADAFSRFRKEGILNPEVGDAFRRSILERGNLASAEELFRDFMGRDPDRQAMLKRRGLDKK